MRLFLCLAALITTASYTMAAMLPAVTLRVPAAVRELCKPSDIEQKSPTEYEVTSGLRQAEGRDDLIAGT